MGHHLRHPSRRPRHRLQPDQKQRLRTIGTDIAIFFGGKTGAQAGGYAAGRDIRLTVDDAIAIQQQASLVKTVSPELRRTVSEVSQWNAASRAVRGVWPEYQRFRSLTVEQGRLMTEQDEAERRAASSSSATKPTASSSPAKHVIGETLMVNGYQYTVIGVLEKKKQNGSYGSGPDNTQLFTTYSAMARDFPPPEQPGIVRGFVNNIVIEPVSPDLHEKASTRSSASSPSATTTTPTTKKLSGSGTPSRAPNSPSASSAS